MCFAQRPADRLLVSALPSAQLPAPLSEAQPHRPGTLGVHAEVPLLTRPQGRSERGGVPLPTGQPIPRHKPSQPSSPITQRRTQTQGRMGPNIISGSSTWTRHCQAPPGLPLAHRTGWIRAGARGTRTHLHTHPRRWEPRYSPTTLSLSLRHSDQTTKPGQQGWGSKCGGFKKGRGQGEGTPGMRSGACGHITGNHQASHTAMAARQPLGF